MARGVAVSILPMTLSLAALLLVAGTISAAAAVSGDTNAIRLPSDVRGVADLVTAMATTRHGGGDKERPWECCDVALCLRSWPPTCTCRDQVERCSDTCKDCEEQEPSRYICKDWYRGQPGPKCGEDDGNSRHANVERGGEAGDRRALDVGAESRMTVVRGAKKTTKGQDRPWKCCDKAVHGPEGTAWYCMDKVQQCSCNLCFFELKDSHSYYYCLDGYPGSDPGPTCSHE